MKCTDLDYDLIYQGIRDWKPKTRAEEELLEIVRRAEGVLCPPEFEMELQIRRVNQMEKASGAKLTRLIDECREFENKWL